MPLRHRAVERLGVERRRLELLRERGHLGLELRELALERRERAVGGVGLTQPLHVRGLEDSGLVARGVQLEVHLLQLRELRRHVRLGRRRLGAQVVELLLRLLLLRSLGLELDGVLLAQRVQPLQRHAAHLVLLMRARALHVHRRDALLHLGGLVLARHGLAACRVDVLLHRLEPRRAARLARGQRKGGHCAEQLRQDRRRGRRGDGRRWLHHDELLLGARAARGGPRRRRRLKLRWRSRSRSRRRRRS